MVPGFFRRNPLLTASGLMGLEFPAGGNKVDPSPYPPPKGEVGERKPRGGRLAAAAAFRRCEIEGAGVEGLCVLRRAAAGGEGLSGPKGTV